MNINEIITPILTVDIVLFTIVRGELHLVLSKRTKETNVFPERPALIGGYVHANEDRDLLDSAIRILKNKIGFTKSIYLEQLEAFSGPYRDPRGWSVSQAYCAIVPLEDVKINENIFLVKEVEATQMDLPFDHNLIINKAFQRIKSKSTYSILPAHFFKDNFTLTDLQKVYEVILGQKIDKSSFRKRINDMDILKVLEGKFKIGVQRPAQLYSLKSDKSVWFKSNIKS